MGIGQKLHENTSRSLKQIGQKDGIVYKNIKESLRRVEEQIKDIETQRAGDFLKYFKKSLVMWECLEHVKTHCPCFSKTRAGFKADVIDCIHYNPPTEHEEEGKVVEPDEPVNIDKSVTNLRAHTINYIITSLTYQQSLLALALLSIFTTAQGQPSSRAFFSELLGVILMGKAKLLPQWDRNALARGRGKDRV